MTLWCLESLNKNLNVLPCVEGAAVRQKIYTVNESGVNRMELKTEIFLSYFPPPSLFLLLFFHV